jgi:O-antigen ligase
MKQVAYESIARDAIVRRCQRSVIYALLVSTLAVTPQFNLDPINLPKFLAIVAFAGLLVGYIWRGFLELPRALVISSGLFLVAMLSSSVTAESSLVIQAYGAFGRNTGLLTYVALLVLLLATVVVTRSGFSLNIVRALIFISVASAIYGLVQWSGNDPVNWDNPYNAILGTLGNPNFISAFLGMGCVASMALLLDSGGLAKQFLWTIVLIPSSIFLIVKSDASQGLILVLAGMTLLIYLRFIRPARVAILSIGYLILTISATALAVLGLLQRGPLARFLYQDSITYRGDYWRAGIEMTLAKPFTGVGMDSYGDWYRTSRTSEAALRRGPDVTSNSAHNVFFDLSSNGGFPLLIAYLLLCLLIVRSLIRIISRSKRYDSIAAALFVSWLAYIIQSVISINQIGLATWGWILGGAIIGYDLYGNREMEFVPKNKKIPDSRRIPPVSVLTSTGGFVIAVLLAMWPVVQDISVRNALESGDEIKIESSVNQFPQSSYYYVYASQVLLENKLEDKALEMAKKAIEINPRDFNAWKLLAANPTISESERAAAIAKMKELDPFNNTLGD